MGGSTTFIETVAPIRDLQGKIVNAGTSATATTEQDFLFSNPLNPREERKLHELQLLDIANNVLDKDAWDIMEVKAHRVTSMEQNIPREGST
jgi:hypothetical protein